MQTTLFQNLETDLYLDEHTLGTIPYNEKIIKNVVSKMRNENLVQIKDETLGSLFEKLIKEEERKTLGQFYTPPEIVDYIIKFLDLSPNSKVLDPTCGCGVFLVKVFNQLKKIDLNALDNIYGVDLNESATKITRINLWLREGRDEKTLKILENNIKVGNSIVRDPKISDKAFDWNKEFSDIIKNGGFDFIIGNPPYTTLKKGKDYVLSESIFSNIANGNMNAASLVLARSIQLLKKGGILAFVLPKNLLRVDSYSKLRSYILKNTKILHILDLGCYFKEVRGEQIILFLQNPHNIDEIKKNFVLIKIVKNKGKDFDKEKGIYIPQHIFQEYNSCPIFYDENIYKLVGYIEGEPLGKIADIFRGLSINPKSTHMIRSDTKITTPIIKGNNISKGKYTLEYFVDVKQVTKNSEKFELLKKKKIILQNIFSSEAGIISCIDNSGHLNFDTVTNIVLKKNDYELGYIFGLLNSKLLNFYLMYMIYNVSKLTIHTDKAYIGKLPIKKVGQQQQNEIIEIMNNFEKTGSSRYLRELDNKIFKFYDIDNVKQKLIETALEQIMSKKSLW